MSEVHTILASWFTNSLLSRVYSSMDWWCLNWKYFTVVSFNFCSFSQTKIISHAQKNIISTDADMAHFLWRRKDSLSSKICSKHQEQQRRSLGAWRYRWLACVLSQVVRTSSPGSRPRQFFPSLPNPRTGLFIPLKKLFYSQRWRVLLQFSL